MSVSFIATFRDEPPSRISGSLRAARASAEDAEFVLAAPLADHHIVLQAAAAVGTQVRVVENPSGGRSAGLNASMRNATGDVIVRIDARSLIPPAYVARAVRRLEDRRIGVVGGHQVPAAAAGRRSAGIARGLAHPWLLGGAPYRRRNASGAVDTVYLGVFRRRELMSLGGWDERLTANEDFDVCRRYRDAGFTVFLEPGLDVAYMPRETLGAVWAQYRSFGVSKAAYWRLTGHRPNGRQAAALAGAFGATAAATALARSMGAGRVGVLGAVALAGADHVAEPREPDPLVRGYAILTECAAVGGWLCGVASGTAGGVRRSLASAPARPSPNPWCRHRQ